MDNSNILSDDLSTISDKNATTVYGMFMTPVGVKSLTNHQQHKQTILDYISKLSPEDVTNSSRKDINNGVLQLGQLGLLNLEQFLTLKEDIIEAVVDINSQSLCYDLGDNPNIIDDTLELTNKGGMYAPHEQSNCLYSATYFVNWDVNLHSPLQFKRNVTSTHYPVIQYNQTQITPFNMLDGTVPITEGCLCLYPSNMVRGYQQNNEGNRISLTFNIGL